MMFPDTGRDVIKISDFGFSHCLDGDPDLGALKQCLPVYLCPPEVWKKIMLTMTMRTIHMSCLMTKPTKWHVRPAKTQISLGIRSEDAQADQSLLCAFSG